MSWEQIRRIIKHLLVTLTVLSVAIAITAGLFLWQRPWIPNIHDDGSFEEESVDTIPIGTPRQVFPVKRFVLDVFDPPSKELPPIVLLKDKENNVKWAVHPFIHCNSGIPGGC